MPPSLHPLAAEHADAMQALRLKTIRANPETFCSTVQEVQRQGTSYCRSVLQQQSEQYTLYGCLAASGELIGMVAIERLSGTLRAHRGRIWGLMVDPDYRRQGIARQLCQQALLQARAMELEKINLELTGEAVAALHLYRALGFRIECVEPLALKAEGRYLDEIRMTLYL